MSNFLRSNRRSGSTGAESAFSHFHRRATSDAITMAAPQQNLQPADVHSSRSRSTTPSSSTSVGQSSLRGMERLEKRRNMEERNFMQTKARSQNLNPPVDFRALDYVSACDENLTCPICRCPFVDPVVLNECDHCFCRDCIRQTWTATSTYSPLGPRGDCPSCRTPAKLGPRSATSKILINILDDLVVKCPKSDEGCNAEVKRGEVKDHVEIYCGYAVVECPADDCELTVWRKDASQGCLHFGVSCLACHEEMQKCNIEKHWRSKCPDRLIICGPCKSQVYYRDLAEHNERICPAVSIKCPGHSLGCAFRSKKEQADIHAKNCTLAKLGPLLDAQQKRLDEHESTQKQMSHKLEILESGFARMQSIVFPTNPDQNSTDPSSIPLLRSHGSDDTSLTDINSPEIGLDSTADLSEPFADFDSASPFPPPATNGPYSSPLHHMLSMHENLQDEMSRVNTALQELDGRHSMQILNENMRTREEITYFGAQVAGLSRQVHWLTSAQLQRQSRSPAPGSAATAASDIAAAGSTVEAAISSAVRGAARIVGAGREGTAPMRRGPSEEGRTKL